MDHLIESQDEVLKFLANPDTHGGHAVRRIDTHAATVFLAGERALKIKRAVRYPFLDYSSLGKRQAACCAELEVNRPFAAVIYRGVVPITREADGRLALGGPGEPVEWAVDMVRFDEDRTLDRLADKGELSLSVADSLAKAVAAAHGRAPLADAQSWISALRRFVEQNRAEFGESPDLFPAADVAALDRASRTALERIVPLLEMRGKLGFIRRGHGDLHLGNIALIDGDPVPFDAIEFDPLIAAGDVLYDLAFLLMDLVGRRLPAHANAVLNRYLTETRRAEDLDALAALPFFMSLRAAIRAKVTAARREIVRGPARDESGNHAKTYFRLAHEMLNPPAPSLIAIGGLSGTGKSALARALAPAIGPLPGAIVLRSDVERKAMFGKGETDRLSPDAYQPQVTARVYEALGAKAERIVKAGHSAIVDAVFAQGEERASIERIARRLSCEWDGLFLKTDLKTRLCRVGRRERDASDADMAIARQQEDYEMGPLSWKIVDASGTPQETLANALESLKRDDFTLDRSRP